MNERDKLANNLRQLRGKKNLTQEELAKALGYSLSGYRKIERGERSLKIHKALLAAEILDCSLDQIFLPQNMPKCVCNKDN